MTIFIALTGCDNTVNTEANRVKPDLLTARAQSRHYVEVRLETPLSESSELEDAFRIKTADNSSELKILRIDPVSDDRLVIATEAQDARSYNLSGFNPNRDDEDVPSIAFFGSIAAEPQLLSAVALDNTTVLLTFSEPLNPPSAEDVNNYVITDALSDGGVEIEVLNATLEGEGLTVRLTTSPQDDRAYALHIPNLEAAYQFSQVCQGDFIDFEFTSPVRCGEELQPFDSEGSTAPLLLSARTQIDPNQPLDPDAPGQIGHAYLGAAGAGVQSTTCGGSTSLSGASSSSRDEEIIFTLEVPLQKEALSVFFSDLNFSSDDPVIFVSTVDNGGFITVDENEMTNAWFPTANNKGTVYFGLLPSIPDFALIDAIKIRETRSATSIGHICLGTPRRLDPTTSQSTFFGIATPDAQSPQVVDATAIDGHEVIVTFSEPVAATAVLPQHYQITPNLTVVSVSLASLNTQAILQTSTQLPGAAYELQVTDVEDPSGNTISTPNSTPFTGGGSPYLVSVQALSNTQALATFSSPLNQASAENVALYQVSPALTLVSAELQADQTSVLLTTSSQDLETYTLSVSLVRSLEPAPDGTPIDPTRNQASFTGFPLLDEIAPQLVSAQAISDNEVLVTFSEPMAPQAADASLFAISPNLVVLRAEANAFGTQVLLTTMPQVPGAEYTLAVNGAADVAGNPVILPNMAAFRGGGAPFMVSAIALSNTQVLVTFSEELEEASAENAAYYLLTPALPINAAELQGDLRSVVLTTTSLQEIGYNVAVSQVKTLAPVPSGEFIDPQRNNADFTGFPLFDDTAPALVSAISINGARLSVSFSEPLQPDSFDPANFNIVPQLAVTAVQPNAYYTQAIISTHPQLAGTNYTLTAGPGVTDVAGNPLDAANDSADFVFSGQVNLNDPNELPRVVGAVSINNTTVRVAFSKVMGEGIDNPDHYSISGGDSIYLAVDTRPLPGDEDFNGVTVGPDRTYVDIKTFSQAAETYTLHVVNVKDANGNPLAGPDGLLAPPDGVDPTTAIFRGTPPNIDNSIMLNEQIDSDGDGFADWFEQIGWFITVTFDDGSVGVAHVTSDPLSVDTDGDKIWDGDENRHSLDPRTDDTDADQISDWDEFNRYYTDPRDQDTDKDGLSDKLEIFYYKTSPILADTDGDQWDDREEIFERNRNPLIADVPVPQVKVGGLEFFLKEVFEYTDEEGTVQSSTRSRTTTLAQSQEQTFSTSDTFTSESTNVFSQQVGVEVGLEFGVLPEFTVSGEIGTEQSRSRGYTFAVDQGSAISASQEEQLAIEQSTEFSQNRSVSRTIEDADLVVDVTVSNVGDVSFTMSDLELAALVRDRRGNRPRDIPVATLLPQRTLQLGEDIQLNLGPFDRDRGPFIFSDVQIFPEVVRELRANPSAVVVELSNFNISSEDGRLFSFSSQDVNDRTAGILIDFGDGRVESYRVATGGEFELMNECMQEPPVQDPPDPCIGIHPTGRQKGITMLEALAIIGLDKRTGIESDEDLEIPLSPEIKNSFGTTMQDAGGGNQVEVLTRVRGIQTVPGDDDNPSREFWYVASSEDLTQNPDFSEIVLRGGETYSLSFERDADDDGVFARTEFQFGSSDNNDDTDGDDLKDNEEIVDGWFIQIANANLREVYPSPARADSDFDQVSDKMERDGPTCNAGNSRPDGRLSTNPVSRDTDGDGLTDQQELNGGYAILLADGNQLMMTPYINNNGDDDAPPADRILHDCLFATDPTNPDTDGDGLLDGREVILGSDPNNRNDAGSVTDSDEDGLSDADERRGWTVVATRAPVGGDCPPPVNPQNTTLSGCDGLAGVPGDFDNPVCGTANGSPGTCISSDPCLADTDGDGLWDLFERILGFDPNNFDTDMDGFGDRLEFDPASAPELVNQFNTTCDQLGIACEFVPASGADSDGNPLPYGTSPLDYDTDGDGRSDFDELNTACNGSFTLPRTFDSDQDGLGDGEECCLGTDPRDSDTDGDGRTDGEEVDSGTDPLVPDKRVTFTVLNLVIGTTCGEDGGIGFDDFAELEGSIDYTDINNSVEEIFSRGCCPDEGDANPNPPSCRLNVDGTTATVPINFSDGPFIMRQGDTFRIDSANLVENDANGCTANNTDSFGILAEEWDFADAVSGNRTITVMDNANPSCSLQINVSIEVE
ncbi:MAG: Ig-like domain-containing protein [Phycisphaerae bacterium]